MAKVTNDPPPPQRCPTCGGNQIVHEQKTDRDGNSWSFPVTCKTCGGSGYQ